MYFRCCDLKNKLIFSPPVLLHSEFGLLALFYISETTRTIFFLISSHYLHNVYNNVTPWNFQDKPILRAGQKSALQHSLFWSRANFSRLVGTIHISMTSTFQCKNCQCCSFKRCDKFKLKCTSHGDMYSAHYSVGKIRITSKQGML